MTTTAVHTPLRGQPAKKIGRYLYRKQVLPIGKSITYKGQKLDFTADLARQIVASFNAGAYDSVPFQLADAANTHTNDPERTRGLIKGYELAGDSLDMLLEVGPEGARVIDENPSLGVSARIVMGLERADGATFPAAIQHVLGTLDPRVPGMKPWQKIADLANDPTAVVDLTAASYEGEPSMALTDEQLAKLAAFAEKLNADGTPVTAAPEPATAATTDEAPGDLTDDQIAQILASLEPDAGGAAPAGAEGTPAVVEQEPVLTGAALTAEQRTAIDLAHATAEQAATRVQALEVQLAQERWKNEALGYARAGVPAAVISLAAPVLEKPGAMVVELANSEKVDASAVVRKMLDACKGTVDLTAEIGTVHDAVPDDADAAKARQDAASGHLKAAGIR